MGIEAMERGMRLLREMERLLGEERDALVEGDLGRVEMVLAEKEAVLRRLEEYDRLERGDAVAPVPSGVEGLLSRQEENVSMLRGMMERLGGELSALRERRNKLRLYAEGGGGSGAAFLNGRA